MAKSLSLRRAWIEIEALEAEGGGAVRRSPYGERGLKFIGLREACGVVRSLSLRRAWIEIFFSVPDD